MPTLKQDLIDRIILDAAKHSAAVEAAAADLEAVEALAARLHATGSGPEHDWRPIATPHTDYVSIALLNYRLITAEEAVAALAAAGLEATPAEPTRPGYANDHSQAFDLAGYPFQAIVHNPVSALLKPPDMRKNPGNTNTLRKRLIQEVFAKTHASLREIDAARALIDDTERLTGQLNAGGAEAGHRFEARAMLMLPHVVCRIAIDQPVEVPDVLASILRAGLNYAETYPLSGESIAITLVGHDIPVVVTQPILDFLEVA